MKVLVIVGLIVLVMNIFVAAEFQSIAGEKGYGGSSKYFWYTFLFGPYGMLMVIALPDRKKVAPVYVSNDKSANNTKVQDISDELPDL